MKTIGIMTFHWATNYGAVLQAVSLQKHLMTLGVEAYIIDYHPAAYDHTLLKCLCGRSIKKIQAKFKARRKEQKIEQFRKRNMNRTQRYTSDSEIRQLHFDAYICGSDQIWNPHYTLHGEGRRTLAYYLGFADERSGLIAYAASFGVTSLPSEMIAYIKPQLEKFESVLVRERSAKEILSKIGIQAEIVIDPVFLNDRFFYDELARQYSGQKKQGVFAYILHGDTACDTFADHVCQQLNRNRMQGIDCMGVEEWLDCIRRSDYVITNSFHATAFALIFHVPFFAVLIENSGMNDRILTLLEEVGMMSRVVSAADRPSSSLVNADIDWEAVDKRLAEITQYSSDLLKQAVLRSIRGFVHE